MALFRQTYYIYRRNVKNWITQPFSLVSAALTSAFIMLFFGAPLAGVTSLPGFPSDDYEAFLTGMVLVMAVVFGGADAAMAMLTDIMSGYFDKLLLAPIHRLSILLGSLLMAATRAFAQVVIILTLALAMGVTFKGGVLGILAVAVAATIFGVAMSCVGLMIALKTRSPRLTQESWILFMPLVFLTSAFMPRDLLTGWFKVAVTVNPVEYVLDALRAIIIQGWVWDTILPGLYVLMASTVGLMVAATWLYRRQTA